MKPVFERDKLSIAKCRKILNVNGKHYSDEEIVKIRDWIYLYVQWTLEFIERKTEEINQNKKLLTRNVKTYGDGNKPN